MEALRLKPHEIAMVADFSRPELAEGVNLNAYVDQAGDLSDAEVKARAGLLVLLGRERVGEVTGADRAMSAELVYLNAAKGSGLSSRADFVRLWFSDTGAGQ